MINKKMMNEKRMNEKMKLVFATNNAHKLRELREILGEGYELLSLSRAIFPSTSPQKQSVRGEADGASCLLINVMMVRNRAFRLLLFPNLASSLRILASLSWSVPSA